MSTVDRHQNAPRIDQPRPRRIAAARSSEESARIEGNDSLGRRSCRMAQEAGLSMVLVDTTVWIDFFGGKSTPEVRELERLLQEGEDLCTCGVILTEVLQGIREDADYRRTLTRFDAFLFLPMSRQTFLAAADIYRSLRRRGVTIRKSVDCMIAAVAREHGAALLHHDRDFDSIETHCGLPVVRARPASRARRRPDVRK